MVNHIMVAPYNTGFLPKLTSRAGTAYISGALEFTTGFVLLDR
jgi:hypothetical protein